MKNTALMGGLALVVIIGAYIFMTTPDSTDTVDNTSDATMAISKTQPKDSKQQEDKTPTPTPIQKEISVFQKSDTPTPQKDTTAPMAYILDPKNNATVVLGTDVKIVANVTDDVKIDRVEFYAGSSDYQHIGTVKQAPFEVIWNVDSRFDNSINIPVYIKAFDIAGNRTDSSILVVAKRP